MTENHVISFENIDSDLITKWQGIVDLLAKIITVPAALIMKTENEHMEVLVSSKTENNPYHPGNKEQWYGLYCETVIKTQKELLVPNATTDAHWNKNPDIKLGMIAYLGYPINFPDHAPFGTLCVLDNRENYFSPLHKQLMLQLRDTIEMDIALLKKDALRNQAEARLKSIEWMLSPKKSRDPTVQAENQYQYGDLTELNLDGSILKSIGHDHLINIANDYLELLGTCSAIYEKNGDYALGIFSSGWCRMMDYASHKLFNTPDNAEALNSGKWLCHESCWTDCSRIAIAEGKPVDIECSGGIRIYCEPIFADNKVVGSINFGYGDPPKEKAKLQELAASYHLDYNELVKEAHAYESRPPFVIEMAKNRLHGTARLIGSIVEKTLSQEALRESERILNKTGQMAKVGGWSIDVASNKLSWTNETCRIHEVPLDFKPDIQMAIQYYHPDDRELISRAVNSAIEQGESFDMELRLITSKGNEIWVRAQGEAVRENGVTVKLSGTFQDITERKQAQEKLRASEERLNLVIKGSNDAPWDWDLDTNEIYYSPQWWHQLGYEVDELEANASLWEKLLNPDDKEKVDAIFRGALQNNLDNYEVEFHLRGKKGQYVPVLSRGHITRDVNGRPNRVSGTNMDLTERKQAEINLHKSQLLLQSSLESPQSMIIMSIDRNYRYLYFNKAHVTAMKYAYNTNINIGMNVLDCITSEEDRQSAKENYDRAMAGESHTTIQVYGEIDKSYYENLYNPIIDEKEEIIGVSVFAQDITERKQSELALFTEKERLAVTLRSIGDGVITTDSNGRITLLNNVAENMTGWKSEVAAGKPLPEVFDIINERTRKRCENPFERVIATNSIVELENHTCLKAKDGREFVIADSGAPIRDKDNNIIGVVLVFRDMTEKQKLEDSIQKTQKLESLGLLAGGIAHDFNNLMGGIFGYIDLACEFTKEPKASNYLSKALGTIGRARALTQQLLTFAKGGAPIKKIERLFPFIQETTQFALSGSRVSCSFQIPENLWPCDIDKNQIGQVIDNIIINAQQAMPDGGRIEVAAQNISFAEKQHTTFKAGNYVKLSIKDQGIGIPKEFIPRIFDPFFTTKSKGHGLGLPTCYSIVNRHSGYIEVESEPGKGSTFNVYLPASANSVSAAEKESEVTFRGDGTFLVMDDEEVMRETIGGMLNSLGYTVVLKESGEDAVDWFAKETEAKRTVAGMVFDLTIPGGMGGREAIGEIRKLDLKTPVFVASGYAEDPVMSNPKDYGFSASICKPFRKSQLTDMLEKHMKK
jgi:PAS domain S-box-containing protein